MKFFFVIFLCFLILKTVQSQSPEVVVQTGHASTINAISFSPNGKFIVTGGLDKNIIVWDYIR